MILGPHIRAVTFDVGGTLIEPWLSVGHVYSTVAARHGINISPEVLNKRFATVWQAKHNFGHSMRDWSDLVDATFGNLTPKPPSRSFFPELYEEFAVRRSWKVFDDVVPYLTELQERKLRLAVISNWDGRLRPLLVSLNLAQFFETIVVSIEVGTPKPNANIFNVTAARLQLRPDEILHIGDSSREDVEGARNAGFDALLINRHAGQRLQEIAQLCEDSQG
jgi:putative hydrolase of the HAD superfamily